MNADDGTSGPELCPQEGPLVPVAHADISAALEGVYASETFKDRAVEWLVGAIRIPYVLFCSFGFGSGETRTDLPSCTAHAPAVLFFLAY